MSAISFTSIGQSDIQQVCLIITAILSGVSTIISVVQNKLEFDKRAELYLTSSKRYAKIYRKIEKELVMKRTDGDALVIELAKMMDSIIDESLPIPMDILNSEEFGELEEIEVGLSQTIRGECDSSPIVGGGGSGGGDIETGSMENSSPGERRNPEENVQLNPTFVEMRY